MLDILRRKFTIDPDKDITQIAEGLPTQTRLSELGKSKHPSQRMVCVNELVDGCFRLDFFDIGSIVIPLLCSLIGDSETPVRSASYRIMSEMVGCLLQSDYDSGYCIVTDRLVPLVLDGLRCDPSVITRSDAASAVVQVCYHLRSEDRERKILYPLMSMISTECNEDQRVLLTNLLGDICPAVGSGLASQYVVAQVCSMGEDSYPSVRRACVIALCQLAGVVPPDLIVRRLLPVFGHLCSDASANVRENCVDRFHVLLQSIHHSDGVDTLSAVYPLFLADPSPTVRKAAIGHVGYQLALLPVSSDSYMTLLDTYVAHCAPCTEETTEYPLHYAKTFSAILVHLTVDYWESHMKGCLTNLMQWRNPNGKRILAASMGVVSGVLKGSDYMLEFIVDLLPLFEDPAIAPSLVKTVPDIVSHVDAGSAESLLLHLREAIVAHDWWPPREAVAVHLSALIQAIAVNHPTQCEALVWSTIVPVWLQLIQDPIACVRLPAIDATTQLLPMITADWTHPTSRSVRLLISLVTVLSLPHQRSVEKQTFIQLAVCVANSRVIPTALFELIFLQPLLPLANDGSVTVRTTWAKYVCPLLRSPGGRLSHQKELVMTAHSKLLDSDAEVVRLAKRVVYCPIDEIECTPPPSPPPEEVKWTDTVREVLGDPPGGPSLLDWLTGGHPDSHS